MKGMAKRTLALLFAVLTAMICCVPAWAAVGDLDGNGKTQSTDARLLLRHCAKLQTLSAGALKKADLNYDGAVNSADARVLLRASAKMVSLEHFEQYYMQAKFTNSSTGTTTVLDTAWQNGKVLINLNDTTMLLYDDADGTVTMINHQKKQYTVMTFAEFKKQYPNNAAYFANGAKELCWSEDLPNPLYLEDQGFSKSVSSAGGQTYTVYRKNFSNGYQSYTFDSRSLPVKSEFYAEGTLMTLDFIRFDADPTYMFTAYREYNKVS